MIFFVKHCHINFQTCENQPNVTHVYCEIAQVDEIDMSTVDNCCCLSSLSLDIMVRVQ